MAHRQGTRDRNDSGNNQDDMICPLLGESATINNSPKFPDFVIAA